ncbi:MAG: response regulator transcription factor [Proteobacteria bacterium]|nr:response regulator transcription factor [Pseudomonadota bacterium]MBU1737958.1 response regulator transcription factor [Pseudomonadota bacterium]
MNGKKILLVDDHPVVREGIRAIIQGSAGGQLVIVGETGKADAAFDLVEKHRPDLAIIDITLSGAENGISLTGRITDFFPGTRVLILSMYGGIDYVCRSLKAGAAGYLTKNSAHDELLNAINVIMRGGSYLDNKLSPDIVDFLKNHAAGGAGAGDPSYSLLSEREQQVFRMLADGEKVVEIGRTLNLSPKTVENHKTSIFKKLHFTRYFDLYRYAHRIGIIKPDV